MGFIISGHDRRWTHAEVPYEISATDFPPESAQETMILDAIDIWNEARLVRLFPRNGHDDFVRFQTGGACNSPVGRQGGQQAVSCALGAGFGRGSAVHELGHAIGLIHEQSRPDRNSFVTVTGTGINYDIDNSGIAVGNYDCGSVMHYPSIGGLIANNGPGCAQMGQRISPSRTDLEAVRSGYPIHEIATLGDTSDLRVALAGHREMLFLGWRGSGNSNLSVSLSRDGGQTFIGKHISPEESSHAPALTSHNGRLYIAWKGDGNEDLNVAKVSLLGNTAGLIAVDGIVEKTILGETSDNAPALASHGGRLFLAWRGSGNDDLNLAFSEDDGATFTGTFTFGESSSDSPALVSHEGRLYMAWVGSGNDDLNLARVDFFGNTSGGFGIEGLSGKVTLGETSDFSPALGSCEGLLYMAWRGSGNEELNIIASADGAGFFDKRVSAESSSDAPALGTVERRLHYGWKGSNNENINVGGVTTLIRPVGLAQNGNVIHGTSGNKGNYELLVSIGGAIQPFFRNNDALGLPWNTGPAAAQPAPPLTPEACSLIQSRGPAVNLAAVHWLRSAAGSNQLAFAQSLGGGAWTAPAVIVADGSPIQGVTGKPSFLQGSFGGFGNFELAVPAGPRILNYWRDNDAAGTPWHGPVMIADFTPSPGTQLVVPVAVSMVQSSFGNPGNLELVVRMSPRAPGFGTPRPDYLVYFSRDGNGWHGPEEIKPDGQTIDNVTGDPSLIWSTFGLHGNLELVVPVRGLELAHYWRDNDRVNRPWRGPTLIQRFPPTGPFAGRPLGVSLLQSRYGVPGDLEAVVRVDPRISPFSPAAPHFLARFFRDVNGWQGPMALSNAGGTVVLNVTGF